ncbi:MAG: hypothetical protein ACLFUJ_02680 [Phycisphaerae bacterium]
MTQEMHVEEFQDDRVREHDPEWVEEVIRRLTRDRLREFVERMEDIEYRLAQLDEEWDIERTLEANAATISLASLLLGLKWKKWSYFPFVIAGFLLQHAIQGWCPPVEIFRRMGIRTAREINRERTALKAIRGDFADLPESGRDRADAALAAADKDA